MDIYQVYVKEICPYCLNKDKDLCNISRTNDGIKCAFYEKDRSKLKDIEKDFAFWK